MPRGVAIPITAALLCFTPSLNAQSYCSLSVNLIDPQGRAVLANVSVQESDGRTEEKNTSLGSAQFCDLGMKPVDITVGHTGCNQVIIKSVGLRWGITTNVKIIYDREPCLIDPPPVAACQMLFRFADTKQHWVKGVRLKLQSPEDKTLRADDYGRVHIAIPAFKELLGVASVPDHESAEIRIPCTSENHHLEQRITLRSIPSRR
jgi:hypothetical protein